MKAFLGVLVALVSGCVPYIVPPARVSAGVGPAVGELERPAGPAHPRSVTQLRAGFHPLGLLADASRRPLNVGLGYQGDFLFGTAAAYEDRRATAHGPYLEAGYYPYRRAMGPRTTLRLGAQGSFNLLFLEPSDRTGYGGSLAAGIELSGDIADPYSSSSSSSSDDGLTMGVAYGQWAIGGFLGGSTRFFGDARYAGVTAGISARVPLLFGVVCCLGFDDDNQDQDHDDDPPRPRRLRRRDADQNGPSDAPREHVPAKPRPVSPREPSREHVPAKPRPVERD